MQRLLVVIVMLACVLFTADQPFATGRNQVSLQEQTLYEMYFVFTSSWNKNDPNGMVQFYAEDADHFAVDGHVAQGRDAIRDLYAQQLKTMYRGSKLTLTLDSLRFISPETAVANGEFEITGVKDAQGNEIPPIKGLHTDVWTLRDGEWRVAASRPMLPIRMAPATKPS